MKQNQQSYTTLGLMSGSSLDGLDIAAVRFKKSVSGWSYSWLATEGVEYSTEWVHQLSWAYKLSPSALHRLDGMYGEWLGKQALDFLDRHALQYTDVDLIGSHGHTVFHQPNKGITKAIGSGARIAEITKIKTVADLREADVAAGGQGGSNCSNWGTTSFPD